MKIKYTTHPKSAKLKVESLREMHRQKMFNHNMSIVEFDNEKDLTEFLREIDMSVTSQMLTNLEKYGNHCLNLIRSELRFNGQSYRQHYENDVRKDYYTIVKYKDL